MKNLIFVILIIQSISIFAQQPDQERFDKMLRERDSLFYSNLGGIYPDFSIVDLEDGAITEHVLKGKVTLINFWFTGCAPCIAEFEALSSLYKKYENHSNIQFIAITKDPTELAQKAVQKYQLPYPIYAVESKECTRLSFNGGYPTTIIIDQTGAVAYLTHGGSTNKEQVKKDIQKIEKKILEILSL